MLATPRLAREWGPLALVIGAAIIPYLNALGADFTFDDLLAIRQSPLVTGPLDGWGILATPLYPGDLYRPLTLLSYALNEKLAPASARTFHAVNIGLHALVTALVFALGRRWCRSRPVALVAALLFAVHPVHTEAVTSIVGRAELLSALFGMLALVATLAAMASTRPGWDTLALVAFGAAVFSKESGITILPLVTLCRAAHRGGSLAPAVGRELRSGHWIPFLAVAGLFVLARTQVVGSLTSPIPPSALDNFLAYVPLQLRIRTACAVLTDYAGLLLVPLVLSADYSWSQVVPQASWASAPALCGVALLAGSLFGGLWWARPNPRLSVLAVFPLVTLSLTGNFLFAIGTTKAERLLYLPSAGVALFVVALAAYLSPRRIMRPAWLALGLLAGVVVAFSARTWLRNRDWRDNLTLFAATVRTAPRSAKAHHNLGTVLHERGELDRAALHLRQALELYADYDDSAFDIALIYEQKGLAKGAEDWYRKTLVITPAHSKANENLCGLLYRERDYQAAERACRRALSFAPANANCLKGLGGSLLGQGERERGLEILRRSLALNPSDSELRALVERLTAGQLPQEGG